MNDLIRSQRAIAIFDSKFGNTAEIAKSLANGLQRAELSVDCTNIKDTRVESLSNYDLIAVGAPTQAFTASIPMKDFLKKLGDSSSLKGKRGFAFDTKFASRLSGSASKYIEGQLTRLGMELIRPRQSAIVEKSEGPLAQGEPETFDRIGFEIGTSLT